MPGRRDAPAFAVTDGTNVGPAPRRDLSAGCGSSRRAVRSSPDRAAALSGWATVAEPLLPLSIRNLARRGSAASYAITRRRPARAAARQRQCHDRLASALRRSLNPAGHAASSSGSPPPTRPSRRPRTRRQRWHAHGFGRDIAALAADAMGPHVPRAAWERVAVGTAQSPGPRAMDARTGAARPVHGPDPERHRAGAAPRRPLPVGAGRAVRRRPQRAGHRGPCVRTRAASTTPNTTWRGSIAKSCTARPPNRPGSWSSGSTPAHAGALDAGGTPSAELAAALASLRSRLDAAVRSCRAVRRAAGC